MALFRSISGRLLMLTVIFVMLAEILIFAPSIARFRYDYLQERLERAQLASLSLLATTNDMVDPQLERELLDNAEVYNIALRRNAVRELVLNDMPPGPVAESFDLRETSALTLIADAFRCVVNGDDRVIRVIGRPSKGAGLAIEITMGEGPLKDAMRNYSIRILVLSLVISIITATLIFLTMRHFVVSPILGVVDSIAAFRADPEDPSRVIVPKSRVGEIAAAEQELAGMQHDIRSALTERSRLAALGLAVAKISHDLRNILASTQLLADRLETSRDPQTVRTGSKLIGSLDRAIALCRHTLDYGKAEEPPPERRQVALARLVDEVIEMVSPVSDGPVLIRNDVPRGVSVSADPDQLFRILANLTRNAYQAIESAGIQGSVRINAELTDTGAAILVEDDGPGLPTRAMDNLFQPFKGGTRRDGSGLGLAIAHELARGHGGCVELVSSTTEGTSFRIYIPTKAC